MSCDGPKTIPLSLRVDVANCESTEPECAGEQHVGRCPHEQLETVLQELPGRTPSDRLLVVHVERCDGSLLVLRQQNRGAGIGWFTQSSVEVSAGQLGPLRLSLQASPRLASGGLTHSTVRQRFKVVS